MEIQLAEGCTQRHIALIKQYLTNPSTISPSDWRVLLSAFDLLRDTRTCAFDDISKVLPYPAELSLFGETLVVVEYALWKDKIKKKMEGGA